MRFHFSKIDWKKLRDDKGLKFNVGLAVVVVIFFVFFFDTMFTASRFKRNVEERPKKEEKIVSKAKPVVKEVKEKAAVSEKPARREKPVRREKAAREKAIIRKRSGETGARVAIILDDAGGTSPDYKAISSIKEPLTISVLPQMPTSASVARAMADAGFEVMLHLPMEPMNGSYRRSGGGMINCSDGDDKIRNTVLDDLSSVKWAVGINNHMGSKATADERVMKDVFDAMKGKDLYFIDSKTTDKSVAFNTARNYHILSSENNIFLDSNPGEPYVKACLRRLVSMARQKGSAVGIGHATRPATIAALKEQMPEYESEGVTFVFASEIVK